ncbi:hypothetical protein IFM89_004840 [Coptis chinensis]|uniref:Zinc finger protein 830 n=1 Tax=Coptis chinensis TaxID=261450 RepID=A0A835LLF1_9MAGN|nr:hypothetical protein IFM89_004840 [Coptis chinensis]
MDARKAAYRAKLKEAAQKRDKRIDSPLVRYNEHDQPICRVCDVVLKSESLWAAHQASRKHHEAISAYKVKAGQAQNIRKSEPPVELLPKARPSSTLPADFLIRMKRKGRKLLKIVGLGTGEKIGTDTLRGSVKSLDAVSSKTVHGKSKSFASTSVKPLASENQIKEPSIAVVATGRRGSNLSIHSSHTTQNSINTGVRGSLPEGFFDGMDIDATTTIYGSNVKQMEGTLPDGYFANTDFVTTKKVDGSEIKQVKDSLPEGFFDREDVHTKRDVVGSEVKQGKGALPEGFFDNKDADQRARGIEPVKIDIKDEYKEFEKQIQEDVHEVDERYEEEEIDAAEDREEEETFEQRAYRERVEMLKKKQLELRAARFGGQKSSTMGKDSSDEE